MENTIQSVKNGINNHTPESCAPPQVFSPLPIRTPVVHGVEISQNTFLDKSISLLDTEELCRRKFKSSKFLLEKFDEISALSQEIEKNQIELNSQNQGVNNTISENPLFKNKLIFPTPSNHESARVSIERLPARVGNPIINDENFSRNDQTFYRKSPCSIINLIEEDISISLRDHQFEQ